MNMKRLQLSVNEFNAIIDKASLNYFINIIEEPNSVKLVLGGMEQLSYGTYQCVIYKGSIEKCIEVMKAIKLVISAELGIY